MSRARMALEVARWEFQRYFKLRQQIVGIAILVFTGLAIFGLVRLADREDPVDIAVIGDDILPVAQHATPELRFSVHTPAEQAELRTAVNDDVLDALLHIHSVDRAELYATRRGEWIDEVRTLLAGARQEVALRRADMTAAQLADVLAAPDLVIRTAGDETDDGPRTGRFALIVVLSVMLFTVFMGMSYIFTSITGEKQLRVTEQVIAAIPAQAWIDGKILGLTAVSLASVAGTFVGFGVLMAILRVFGGSFPLPTADSADPVTLLVILAFGALGLFFWFAFLAAIAAMIDDPNTSTRSSFLFLPVLATGVAFLALRDPDSTLFRILALLPPTTPGAMPARMLLGNVGVLEVALSIALLAAAVIGLRTAAGRVFRLAMLMYGKEPTWGEVRRWIATP